MCFSSFKLRRCERWESVTTTTSISDTQSNVFWIWMSFRAAFTCQVSNNLKINQLMYFYVYTGNRFLVTWSHRSKHGSIGKVLMEMFSQVNGDTTGRVVKCCLLTILDVILENGNDPSSNNALASYLRVFIVPSQQGLERDQFPLVTLYELELKMS